MSSFFVRAQNSGNSLDRMMTVDQAMLISGGD